MANASLRRKWLAFPGRPGASLPLSALSSSTFSPSCPGLLHNTCPLLELVWLADKARGAPSGTQIYKAPGKAGQAAGEARPVWRATCAISLSWKPRKRAVGNAARDPHVGCAHHGEGGTHLPPGTGAGSHGQLGCEAGRGQAVLRCGAMVPIILRGTN